MEHLEGILDIVDRELGAVEANNKFRSRDEIDSVYKLVDIAKDIYCIWEYEGDGESYDGSERAYRSYNDGSYARGRRNARRDSRGRYARSYRSYDDEYKAQLHDLMQNAPDEQTRQSIQRMIDQM